LRREKGASVKELAALLGVSRSTVSVWVRDIELTEEQQAALRRRMGGRIDGARVNTVRGLQRRRSAQATGRRRAREQEPLHVAGCMLFWAEGSRARHTVEFVNSDPAMIAFFVGFLRRCYGVSDSKLRITCNLFADHEERQLEIESFWLDLLDLPRSCLRKSSVNRFSKYSKKKRTNKLPYGTCRITVADTRLVQNLYGAIQEYGGFEREEWVL